MYDDWTYITIIIIVGLELVQHAREYDAAMIESLFSGRQY